MNETSLSIMSMSGSIEQVRQLLEKNLAKAMKQLKEYYDAGHAPKQFTQFSTD